MKSVAKGKKSLAGKKPVLTMKKKASNEAEDFASKTDKLINSNSDDLTMAD